MLKAMNDTEAQELREIFSGPVWRSGAPLVSSSALLSSGQLGDQGTPALSQATAALKELLQSTLTQACKKVVAMWGSTFVACCSREGDEIHKATVLLNSLAGGLEQVAEVLDKTLLGECLPPGRAQATALALWAIRSTFCCAGPFPSRSSSGGSGRASSFRQWTPRAPTAALGSRSWPRRRKLNWSSRCLQLPPKLYNPVLFHRCPIPHKHTLRG